MKTCRQCGESKLIEEFYVHPMMADGHLNKCKACVRARVLVHRESNLERIRAYDRLRGDSDRHRMKVREYSRKYRLSRRNLLSHERYKAKNPHKVKAINAANNALRDGKLQRRPCEHCGSTVNLHKHHEDYSKPLDVIWLCWRCHERIHHGKKPVPF